MNRPILRAPPFPGARPAGGPISARDPHLHRRSGEDLDAVCQAIAKARIGGDFWSVLSTDMRFEALVRARSTREAEGALERARQRFPGPVLLSLPGRRRPMRKVRPGVFLILGSTDAWTLFERTDHILTPPEDEFSLLAAAAGREVLDLASVEPANAAECRSTLVRALGAFTCTSPFSGEEIDLHEWIDILGSWRTEIDANRSIRAVAGIRAWKRQAMTQFLWSDRRLKRIGGAIPGDLPPASRIGVWPSRVPHSLVERAEQRGLSVVRIEDGFVRSVGLGVHLHRPSSIVLDTAGIYYDPSVPSDLERLLSRTEFPDALIRRSRTLIDRLVRGGVTKYAAGGPDLPPLPPAIRRVLVPGQVEDDLSVRLGGGGVAGNLDLLRRVREAEPDAWILYRPHPDVVAGLRKGHIEQHEALRYADAVLADGSIAGLLGQVNCVHVLTSLAGFEALLRGREVVTHGQPFYAGWGLTRDLGPAIPRRQRRLTLPELVAGALILYPRYRDPVTRLPCPPEVLVDRHVDARPIRPRLLNRLRAFQGGIAATCRRGIGAAA